MNQSQQSKPTILIVDDEKEIVEMMVEAISDMGYGTEAAGDGNEAFEVLKRKPVDIVLSDIMMPHMTGIQLLARCRKSHILIPFVCMTGYCTNENIIEAVRLGAMDFLQKPIDFNELERVLSRVNAIAERLRQMDELLQAIGKDLAPQTHEQLDSLNRQINFLRVMGQNNRN